LYPDDRDGRSASIPGEIQMRHAQEILGNRGFTPLLRDGKRPPRAGVALKNEQCASCFVFAFSGQETRTIALPPPHCGALAAHRQRRGSRRRTVIPSSRPRRLKNELVNPFGERTGRRNILVLDETASDLTTGRTWLIAA